MCVRACVCVHVRMHLCADKMERIRKARKQDCLWLDELRVRGILRAIETMLPLQLTFTAYKLHLQGSVKKEVNKTKSSRHFPRMEKREPSLDI